MLFIFPGSEIQTFILNTRTHSFLHAHILLFRPTVTCYCMRGATASAATTTACCIDSSDDSSLSEVMLVQCARISFRVAHELIDIFDRHLNRQTLLGPLPNWWYSVLCRSLWPQPMFSWLLLADNMASPRLAFLRLTISIQRFHDDSRRAVSGGQEWCLSTIKSKTEATWNAALRAYVQIYFPLHLMTLF